MPGRIAALRFVVIQNNATDLAITQDLLKQSGAEKMRVFQDVKEAALHLRGTQADAIICDLDMEPVDGLTFVKMLHSGKMETNRATPLLMTLNADDSRAQQALDAGAAAVATKPLNQQGLLQGLGQCLKK